MFAAYLGSVRIVHFLIKPNPIPAANASLATKDGATALILASQNGHLNIVEEILSNSSGRASINMQDKNGRTALHFAALKGFDQIASLLIDSHADTTVQDNQGVTCLMLAAAGSKPEKTVPKLVEAKAPIDVSDQNGWTALIISAERGNLVATRMLLNALHHPILGHVLNAKNNDGATALIAAVAGRHDKIVDELLLPITSLNERRKSDNWTALFYAVYWKSTHNTKLLLSQVQLGTNDNMAAEVNRRCETTGFTPLHVAVLREKNSVVNIIVFEYRN